MGGHIETFLSNLAGAIAPVDANLGPVLVGDRRWSTEQDLRDAGAIVSVVAGGVLSTGLVGKKATRFFVLTGYEDAVPFTNASEEYRSRATIVGFYGHSELADQGVALLRAANLVLDKLSLRDTELGLLAAGIGDGYMGYCADAPRMLGPVRTAELGELKVQGFTVQLSVPYFEEVSR